MTKTFEGGCLCGQVRYAITAAPINPHLCSCKMCQRWSGAPTVAWVEFPIPAFQWTNNNVPKMFQSSEKTLRGNCPDCGSPICAIDEGNENISVTIASLDDPNQITPTDSHSFEDVKPNWWTVKITPASK